MSEILHKKQINAGLRQRMAVIKNRIQAKKGWKIDFCEKYPGYNSVRWAMIISNVVTGLTVPDMDLAIALEEYAMTLPEYVESEKPMRKPTRRKKQK